MSKVNLGLKSMGPDEVVSLANKIKTAMTGNANFTTPNPTLTAINGTAVNPESVATLTQTISNPPTQAQVQAIQNKINELINAIIRSAA